MTQVNLSAHRRSVVMNVDPEDHIGRVISTSGRFYERDLLEDAYQKLLVSGNKGVVVDVGAHVGNHTLWFTAVCGRNVIAIEPNPESVLQLNSHLRMNRMWDRTEIYQVALGAEDGQGSYVPGPAGNTGMGRVEIGEGGVSVTTLDSVMEAARLYNPDRRVALIKIDVEGSAVDVLRGAAETLERDRPLLYVEGEFNEIHAHLGSEWRGFGKFGRTPTWGFRHVDN